MKGKCKCGAKFDPVGNGSTAYLCQACRRAYQREHYQRTKPDKPEPKSPVLRVVAVALDADLDAAREWAGWQAPLDGGTLLMFEVGDFPLGLIVQVDNGPLCRVVRNPYGGQTVEAVR